MNNINSILIIGGSAGADIATYILKKTNPTAQIFYAECYSDKINSNILFDKVENAINFIKKENVDYFIATGDNYLRRNHYEYIRKSTNKYPINCIHPSAIIETNKIGYGNLICPLATLHINVSVGNGNIINTGAVVEHDCQIKDFSQVSPNVTLCGNVIIEDNSFVGAGSTIIPKIVVGKNSIVAAGSVVLENIQPFVLVAGVPSKVKKTIL